MSYRVSGEKTPRTETFKTEEEATIRDMQIKLEKKKGTFSPPPRIEKGVIRQCKDITVNDFLKEFVSVYGLKKWDNKTYSYNTSLIRNYIVPYIGERYVRYITIKDMDEYYTSLLDKPAVLLPGHADKGTKISPSTVERINRLLKTAFSKAVAWNYIEKNPTQGVTLPSYRTEKREAWDDYEILKALNCCEDANLRLCLSLSVGCSMRVGEILGLQWGRVHIEEELKETGDAYLEVLYEVSRCDKESIKALESTNRSTIVLKFPKCVKRETKTTLVLKKPKNDSSIRTIYIPLALAEELRAVKEQQREYKRLLGDEYKDYGLVVAHPDGRPYESRYVEKKLKQLIEQNDLKDVVFHSVRHTSTSLKLKLSKGNIKAVQGDTGHAEAKMVTDTYAHIFDSDRKLMAKEMDASFFSRIGEDKNIVDGFDMEDAITILQENPELWKELYERMSGKQK